MEYYSITSRRYYLVILIIIIVFYLTLRDSVECFSDNKYQLHDGEKHVRKINVYGLFKNNDTYIRYLITKFNIFEKIYDVEFSYYFFENNSTDSSKKYLKQFMKNRKGKLYSKDFVNEYKRQGRSDTRINFIKRMETYRNHNIETSKPIKSDWNIILDSDIYFDNDCLKQFFEIKPKKHNIGMMTPYTTIGNGTHYYDTFALVDFSGKYYHPKCIFERCKNCKINIVKKDTKIVEVKSAFAGFAVVDSEVLKNKEVKWKTLTPKAMCEHLGFCSSVINKAKKKVVVCPQIIMTNVEK
jgi:hypothetical protein